MDEIISSYPLQKGIDDGMLVEVFQEEWTDKPIVATSNVVFKITSSGKLINGLHEYLDWRVKVMPTLPEKDKLFVTIIDGETVWVIEDETAITILLLEDY